VADVVPLHLFQLVLDLATSYGRKYYSLTLADAVRSKALCDKVENSQTCILSYFISSDSDLPNATVTKHVRQMESYEPSLLRR